MKKDYRTRAACAATTEFVMSDTVSVAIGALTETVKEGLLALAVRAGLQVMQVMMDDSVTALCGPKGRHDPRPSGRATRRLQGAAARLSSRCSASAL